MKTKYIYLFFVFFLLSAGVGVILNFTVKEEIKPKKINKYTKNVTSKYPNTDTLKTGYLIFRRGYGMDSIVAANFSNEEKRYSHAGIILVEDNEIFVVHSEENLEKKFNGVVKERLSSYLENVNIWAIYKYNDVEINKLTIYLSQVYLQNIKFDMDFDLESDDTMYCSEFIYKTFNSTTGKNIINASKLFLSKRYVTITDLYINKHTSLVEISHMVID